MIGLMFSLFGVFAVCYFPQALAGSWYSIFLTLINSGTFPGESSQGGITAGTASSIIWMPTLPETSLICFHCQKPTFGGGIKKQAQFYKHICVNSMLDE